MSSKKRSKKYTGADAAQNKPHVTRYTAVKKSRAKQWWDDRKLMILGIGLPAVVVGGIGLLLFWLISWIF